MSGADDIGPITSKDDLERAFRSLAQRVDELEAELAEERAKRRQLEHRVGPIDYRGSEDDETPAAERLDGLWFGEFPLGSYIRSRANDDDLQELDRLLDDVLEGTHVPDPGDQPTTIQTFAAMPPEGRASLDASDRRAARIFDKWNKWRRKTPSGKAVLTTSKERDGSSRLLPLLCEATSDDLQWNEVYRAMRQVAMHSGSEADGKDARGGAFEYYHNWSDPWGEGDQTVKALVLQRPELLQPDEGGETA